MKWPTKKLEELRCADFFVNRLNKRRNFSYSVKINEVENSEVDVYANSIRAVSLNLQIVTQEAILLRDFADLRAISKKNGQSAVMGHVRDMNSEERIRNAIKLKEGKYPPEVKRNLVLLISAQFGSLFNEEYVRRIFADLKDSEFHGIYSVRLPDTFLNSSHPHDGQVIAMKDIYGEHGLSF